MFKPNDILSKFGKVATYRHVYRSKPKEPTQFGSVSVSEHLKDTEDTPFMYLYLVRRYKIFVSITTLKFSVSTLAQLTDLNLYLLGVCLNPIWGKRGS